jgi:CRISPR type III-A/MTUBE-associated protein Csm6
MSKRILFSPVGGTDPISSTNMHDGSLLHICRYYQPDVIYLYLSGEILENEKKDDRYMYCLHRLDALQGRTPEYIRIERPKLTNVQEFDFFYGEFRAIIQDIEKTMDPEDELLLNISSGTPAMKSGLLVLKTIGEFPCKAIQVLTPDQKMNNHDHRSYDVEMLWEMNSELEAEGENRCREVSCPTLSVIKQENAIKELIHRYDYAGALAIAQMLAAADTANYMNLLQMASRRILLDASGVDKILLNDSRYKLPVRDGGERKYFEYAQVMQIRLYREEYGDFIRSLSPILSVIFQGILQTQTSIRLEKYCRQTRDRVKWDGYKLAGTDVESVLLSKGDGRLTDIYNSQLSELIEYFCKDSDVVGTAKALRGVEHDIRNPAAHEVMSITDEGIKKLTGYSGKQIMSYIRKGLDYAGFRFKGASWDSYDEMNHVIVEAMDRK